MNTVRITKKHAKKNCQTKKRHVFMTRTVMIKIDLKVINVG